MKTLPVLYKLTSTGAVQVWTIGVDEAVIVVEHGQRGGKMQHTEETISQGKNLGKANATTPAQQALAEATSKWEAKIKKGYVEQLDRAEAGASDVEGGFDCMLAHKFTDHGHKMTWPGYVQPKLNGHRCLAVITQGRAQLFSRTRKPILSCAHIVTELEKMYPTQDLLLDGELYNHTYKDNFEGLTSLIRKPRASEGSTNIQYWVYDVPSADPFSVRSARLRAGPAYVKATETIRVADVEELMIAYARFTADGYEGAMARAASQPYEGKRSYSLQKIKEFLDADFPVVGCKEGRGGLAGCAIFVCALPTGGTFDVKMKGTREQLAAYFSQPTLWTGQTLVVKYQYMSKYNVPIFPVGYRFKCFD